MKKQLTPNDLALIAANAYPNHDYAILDEWDFKSGHSQIASQGDGLAHFTLSESSNAAGDTFEALLEARRMMERARYDLELTVANIERYLSLAIAAAYAEYLFEKMRTHTLSGFESWKDFTLSEDVRMSNACEEARHIYRDEFNKVMLELPTTRFNETDRNKKVLANLREQLSIGLDGIPAGVHNEPLWEPEKTIDAKCQQI